MLTTGRSTPGWNTAHRTAMWSSGSGKPWSFLMKSSEHGCFSLWRDRLECLCRASKLYKVVGQRAQPGPTWLGEGSVFGLSSWFTTRCLSTDSLFTLFLICNSHILIPSSSFSLFPSQELFLLGFSVIVVSAARSTVCGDALPFHAPCFWFCCTFLWGKSVHCHLHISAWQNVRSHTSLGCLSPLLFHPLTERGSMSCGSHLLGQRMCIAWHQPVYLQPYSVLKHSFLWNSCLLFWMSW